MEPFTVDKKRQRELLKHPTHSYQQSEAANVTQPQSSAASSASYHTCKNTPGRPSPSSARNID